MEPVIDAADADKKKKKKRKPEDAAAAEDDKKPRADDATDLEMTVVLLLEGRMDAAAVMLAHPASKPIQVAGAGALTLKEKDGLPALAAAVEAHADMLPTAAATVRRCLGDTRPAGPAWAVFFSRLLSSAREEDVAATIALAAHAPPESAVALLELVSSFAWRPDVAAVAAATIAAVAPGMTGVPALVDLMRTNMCAPDESLWNSATEGLIAAMEADSQAVVEANRCRAATAVGPRRSSPTATRLLALLNK